MISNYSGCGRGHEREGFVIKQRRPLSGMRGGRRASESGGEERQMFADKKQCVRRHGRKALVAVGRKRATIVPRREILCEKLVADKGFLFWRGQHKWPKSTVFEVSCRGPMKKTELWILELLSLSGCHLTISHDDSLSYFPLYSSSAFREK